MRTASGEVVRIWCLPVILAGANIDFPPDKCYYFVADNRPELLRRGLTPSSALLYAKNSKRYEVETIEQNI